MRYYNGQHDFYCGIDLHARTMYLCIVDRDGKILLHRNLPASPEAFRSAVAPFRSGLVVCVECMFTWYWLADLCADDNIPFVLGHALYIKATRAPLQLESRTCSASATTFDWAGTRAPSYCVAWEATISVAMSRA